MTGNCRCRLRPCPSFPTPSTGRSPASSGCCSSSCGWRGASKGGFTRAGTPLTSLGLGLGSLVAGLALGRGSSSALSVWVYRFHLIEIGYAWWAFVLCFLLDDLAYYAFHRSAHRVRWFWASHVVHHTSERYNLSTALRQTWTGFISLNFLFRLPLFLIGFPPPMIFFCVGVNLVYQYWIHTEMIRRMPGWFEAVMNTPAHHRVHHAVNPRYLDRNYAGVFIVWDRMFGSFEPERDEDPPLLRNGEAARLLQPLLGGLPRMGGDGEGRVARAGPQGQARLPRARARLEPRRLARDQRHDPGAVAGDSPGDGHVTVTGLSPFKR